jgi:putative flippase GtrA
MRNSVLEFLSYAVASAAALAVDVSVLTVLVSLAAWGYLPATSVSFTVGGVFLYFISIRFVFRLRRITNRALELPLFVVLGLAGLIVNVLVMFVVIEGAHLHYLLAKGTAAGCTFATNYVLRRRLMFGRLAHAH